MLYFDTFESPMGTVWLTGQGNILTGLSFCGDFSAEANPAPEGRFDLVKNWLDAYFRGVPTEPEFLMEPEGTAFQKLIWKLLLNIPFGETKTYGELAREAARIMGKDRMSAQAVGQAVGHNPIAIIIPCHRVVGAGGKLTGYAYGVERKEWLLRHEQKQEEK